MYISRTIHTVTLKLRLVVNDFSGVFCLQFSSFSLLSLLYLLQIKQCMKSIERIQNSRLAVHVLRQ